MSSMSIYASTLIVIIGLLLLLLIIVVAIAVSITEGPNGAHPPVLAVPRHQGGGGHHHHDDGDPQHDAAGKHFLPGDTNTKETML